MSQVLPTMDGWIGYGDGASILVSTGEPLDADHPVVLERPELFVPVPEVARKRTRGSRLNLGPTGD